MVNIPSNHVFAEFSVSKHVLEGVTAWMQEANDVSENSVFSPQIIHFNRVFKL